MRCFHNGRLLFSLLFKKVLKSCFIIKFMLSCTEYKFSLSITLGATSTAECPHCKLILEAASMPTHEKSCMYRPMKCPQCGEDIATKLWLDHECLTAITNGISSLISNSLLITPRKFRRFLFTPPSFSNVGCHTQAIPIPSHSCGVTFFAAIYLDLILYKRSYIQSVNYLYKY